MPGLDGLSAAEALHEQLPSCRTLVLTGLSQPGNLLRALKVHVRGFLLKDAPAPELANAIRSVAAGRRVLDPELVAAAVETGSSPLTDREADVLARGGVGVCRRRRSATGSISRPRRFATTCRTRSGSWVRGTVWTRFVLRGMPAGCENWGQTRFSVIRTRPRSNDENRV